MVRLHSMFPKYRGKTMNKLKIPAVPSIRRLPSYMYIIRQAEAEGQEFISGTVIAEELHLEAIQVRKDLAITGIIGKPKKGYPIKALIDAIENFLGWNTVRKAIIVGAGSLGTALAGYQEFKSHGLSIVAAFDSDPGKIGKTIHDVPVFSIDLIAEKIKELNPVIALLTLPSSEAQAVADNIVKAGIDVFWNFTNVKIKVPPHVLVEKEDLTSGYAMLGVMMNTRDAQ